MTIKNCCHLLSFCSLKSVLSARLNTYKYTARSALYLTGNPPIEALTHSEPVFIAPQFGINEVLQQWKYVFLTRSGGSPGAPLLIAKFEYPSVDIK